MCVVIEKDRRLLLNIRLQKPQDRVVIRENLAELLGLNPQKKLRLRFNFLSEVNLNQDLKASRGPNLTREDLLYGQRRFLEIFI